MDNTTLDEKISILFQAVPDFGIILSQLSLCKSLKLLGEDEYFEFINASLLRIVNDKLTIDFNPLFMNNSYTQKKSNDIYDISGILNHLKMQEDSVFCW